MIKRLFLLLSAVVLLVTACGLQSQLDSITPVLPAELPSLTLTPESGPSPTSRAPLPAPVLVTVAPGAFDAVLEDAAAGEQFLNSVGDDIVASELNDLMERIEGGEIVFSSPAGRVAGVETAYTYRDMNGDGVEDLVLIVVTDQVGDVKLSAGSNVDGSAVKLAPITPGDGNSVQALSIELDDLVEIANPEDGSQTIILQVVGDQIQILSGLK